MATPSCWRCLFRPSVFPGPSLSYNGSSSLPPLVAAFSSSSSLAKSPLVNAKSKGSNIRKPNERAEKTLRIKKKAFVKTGRPPAPGERKAIRKRIVLSNNNALEVQDMTDMTADLDVTQVGKVLGLPGHTVDQLRAVEAFKITQGWGLFRRPGVLVREESIQVAKMMQAAQDQKEASIIIFDGERGTGKSTILLQAMATAFLKDWIVLSIPEAQELTMAMTEYSPIAGTSPVIYSQNTYTANWLGQIAKANNKALSELQLAKQHTLPIPLQPGISLARLAELGARDPEISWPIFQAFWSEITLDGRPPILLTLDGLNHIMGESAYRSPEFELIHSHDLALIKHFVDYLSGTKKLPNGGAIMAATSKSNNPLSYAVSLAVKQFEEKRSGKEVTKADPWTKIDLRAYDSLQAAEVVKLKGLSKIEARGLMEYWAASGILRQRVDEKTVTEKWVLSGNGVVGEIERSALRVMKI